jgi:thioesterase domain-containing protein
MNNASEKLTYANGELKKSPGARSFKQMRDEAQNDLARVGEMLRQRQHNMEQIRNKYEADKLRFQELKARAPR